MLSAEKPWSIMRLSAWPTASIEPAATTRATNAIAMIDR